MTIIDEPQNLRSAPIDKERLRRKYLEERNKRLRADGNDQYREFKGRFAQYLEDPYTPVVTREPKTDHVTFALRAVLVLSGDVCVFAIVSWLNEP